MAAGPWARGAGRSDDGGDSGVAVTKRFRRITLKGRCFFFVPGDAAQATTLRRTQGVCSG